MLPALAAIELSEVLLYAYRGYNLVKRIKQLSQKFPSAQAQAAAEDIPKEDPGEYTPAARSFITSCYWTAFLHGMVRYGSLQRSGIIYDFDLLQNRINEVLQSPLYLSSVAGTIEQAVIVARGMGYSLMSDYPITAVEFNTIANIAASKQDVLSTDYVTSAMTDAELKPKLMALFQAMASDAQLSADWEPVLQPLIATMLTDPTQRVAAVVKQFPGTYSYVWNDSLAGIIASTLFLTSEAVTPTTAVPAAGSLQFCIGVLPTRTIGSDRNGHATIRTQKKVRV